MFCCVAVVLLVCGSGYCCLFVCGVDFCLFDWYIWLLVVLYCCCLGNLDVVAIYLLMVPLAVTVLFGLICWLGGYC